MIICVPAAGKFTGESRCVETRRNEESLIVQRLPGENKVDANPAAIAGSKALPRFKVVEHQKKVLRMTPPAIRRLELGHRVIGPLPAAVDAAKPAVSPAAKPAAGPAAPRAGQVHPPRPGPAPGSAVHARPDRKPEGHAKWSMPFVFFSRRYKPVSKLEHAGMGLVVKAHDKVLDIDVVLKFVGKKHTVTAEEMELVKREGAMAMRLSHENIVRLHNVEAEAGRVFLVMEFVDGENLRQIIQRVGRLSANTVLTIGQCCASALDYAHKEGIIHKDLKPENIMISRENILKIVDFGTAEFMHKSAAATHIEGTPSYMSPEQVRGEALDVRTDVFALGAVLAEALTGVQVFPFRKDWLTRTEMEPMGIEMVPPVLVPIVLKALAARREDRWSSAGEFVRAFESALTDHSGLDTSSSP